MQDEIACKKWRWTNDEKTLWGGGRWWWDSSLHAEILEWTTGGICIRSDHGVAPGRVEHDVDALFVFFRLTSQVLATCTLFHFIKIIYDTMGRHAKNNIWGALQKHSREMLPKTLPNYSQDTPRERTELCYTSREHHDLCSLSCFSLLR